MRRQAKLKRGTPVRVAWHDASSHDDWQNIEHIASPELLCCVSRGVVIQNTPDVLEIAATHTLDQKQVSGTWRIPWVVITKIMRIK